MPVFTGPVSTSVNVAQSPWMIGTSHLITSVPEPGRAAQGGSAVANGDVVPLDSIVAPPHEASSLRSTVKCPREWKSEIVHGSGFAHTVHENVVFVPSKLPPPLSIRMPSLLHTTSLGVGVGLGVDVTVRVGVGVAVAV
jgi:hypothetical protein